MEDWEINQPGREVTVAHPDYKPRAGAPAEPDDGLSLTARRLKLHGAGGLSDHEVMLAQAELDDAA